MEKETEKHNRNFEHGKETQGTASLHVCNAQSNNRIITLGNRLPGVIIHKYIEFQTCFLFFWTASNSSGSSPSA
jgi:hypothetical protein